MFSLGTVHLRFLEQTTIPGYSCTSVVTDLQLHILLSLLQICPIVIKSMDVVKPVSKDNHFSVL